MLENEIRKLVWERNIAIAIAILALIF
jgi:hypothetical protein